MISISAPPSYSPINSNLFTTCPRHHVAHIKVTNDIHVAKPKKGIFQISSSLNLKNIWHYDPINFINTRHPWLPDTLLFLIFLLHFSSFLLSLLFIVYPLPSHSMSEFSKTLKETGSHIYPHTIRKQKLKTREGKKKPFVKNHLSLSLSLFCQIKLS